MTHPALGNRVWATFLLCDKTPVSYIVCHSARQLVPNPKVSRQAV